jgi:hypothetical protein
LMLLVSLNLFTLFFFSDEKSKRAHFLQTLTFGFFTQRESEDFPDEWDPLLQLREINFTWTLSASALFFSFHVHASFTWFTHFVFMVLFSLPKGSLSLEMQHLLPFFQEKRASSGKDQGISERTGYLSHVRYYIFFLVSSLFLVWSSLPSFLEFLSVCFDRVLMSVKTRSIISSRKGICPSGRSFFSLSERERAPFTLLDSSLMGRTRQVDQRLEKKTINIIIRIFLDSQGINRSTFSIDIFARLCHESNKSNVSTDISHDWHWLQVYIALSS